MSPRPEDRIEHTISFLKTVKKMEETAIIETSPKYMSDLEDLILRVFVEKKVRKLDPAMTDPDEIDRFITRSLQEGSMLQVLVDAAVEPVVLRRLEQLTKDGFMQVGAGSGFRKVEPVEGWFAMVIVNAGQVRMNDLAFYTSIDHKLAVS